MRSVHAYFQFEKKVTFQAAANRNFLTNTRNLLNKCFFLAFRVQNWPFDSFHNKTEKTKKNWSLIWSILISVFFPLFVIFVAFITEMYNTSIKLPTQFWLHRCAHKRQSPLKATFVPFSVCLSGTWMLFHLLIGGFHLHTKFRDEIKQESEMSLLYFIRISIVYWYDRCFASFQFLFAFSFC